MMEMRMLTLSHSEWRLRWLRSDFGGGLGAIVLLKWWRYLILVRARVRMFVIGWTGYSLINLVSSNMSTWTTIVRLGNMLINWMILIILGNLFWSRSRSTWTIYIIICMSISILMGCFLLGKNTPLWWRRSGNLMTLIAYFILS